MSAAGIPMPRLGTPLADGRFAGIVFDAESGQDVALVDLGFAPTSLKHADALTWAQSKGGDLATREEGRILWANLDFRSGSESCWFWLKTQYAGVVAGAWYQDFGDGDQNYYRKLSELRARAVRRLPLQPFSNSEGA